MSDVIPGSSPADQTPIDEPVVGDIKKEGRTPDEVRGEILRKMDKENAELRGMLSQMNETLVQLSQGPQTPATEPSNSNSDDELSQYTVPQLKKYLKAQIDANPEIDSASVTEFNAYISSREAQEYTDKKFESYTQKQQMERETSRFEDIAQSRYPELENPKSAFSLEVQQRLKQLPPELLAVNPKAVLDVANEVAIESDVKPEARKRVQAITKPAQTGTAPADQPSDEDQMSEQTMKEIGDSLKRALPKGTEDFDYDKIREGERYYKANLSNHLRR